MTGSSGVAPVAGEVEVPLPPDAAFRWFANRLDRWWPREYTWGQAALQWIGMQPWPAGRCIERGPGGFECDWGHVIAWEPPALLELAWQIGPRREPVPDPARASRVRVEFRAAGGGTTVRLEHDGFERHGPEGEAYRAALAAAEGWPYILAQYRAGAVREAEAAMPAGGARALEGAVQVRPAEPRDAPSWARMRHALWPDGPETEHAEEIASYLRGGLPGLSMALVATAADGLAGFIELGERDFAEGCDTRPVAYVEGWYVEPAHRRRGVGRALIAAAEDWARRRGHSELASDTTWDNHASAAAHQALGFEEVAISRCFRKALEG